MTSRKPAGARSRFASSGSASSSAPEDVWNLSRRSVKPLGSQRRDVKRKGKSIWPRCTTDTLTTAQTATANVWWWPEPSSAKKDDWKRLSKRWKARLDEDEIAYFKSSHCETLNGQFHKFRALEDRRNKALKMRDDLDEIIQTS